MRVKKQKRHRKVVRFYAACFGFREPFKIICDGTFIHHLIAHDLTPADDVLSHLVGARVLLFTSRCVIGELKSLGKDYAESLQAAQMLVTARCDHEEKRVSAEKCVESIIGGSNAEHFFVATQDAEIRKMFREIPGVPVIYGLRNSLFIEQPSTHQREFVKSTEEKRLHMSDSEYQKLRKIKLKNKLENPVDSPDAQDDSGNELVTIPEKNIARRMLAVTDKSKFKRKRAKGPNPLSCKKKKMIGDSTAAENKDGETSGGAKRKRTRKRKRIQKDNNLGESGC
ncbi:uncharacterized protein A4U43_C07F21390 [Asparagus officinalis]|uniref:UTP23 sensor motif region domain-containing protein n=1 Tax=Asparagus officinalis TaxID=4686 RepID=A0A5P1EH48_ASPOF|nr:rRNA-processing protein UTP23 homolog [Asparagus officinalis]ONK64031.1 uncharacterized protein A4U43_C07F21390 [Asparagus officinalis]